VNDRDVQVVSQKSDLKMPEQIICNFTCICCHDYDRSYKMLIVQHIQERSPWFWKLDVLCTDNIECYKFEVQNFRSFYFSQNSSVSVVIRLRTGWPRNWFLVEAKFYSFQRLRQILGPHSLLFYGCWGWSGHGLSMTSHLHLGPRLRMLGTIFLFPHASWCCDASNLLTTARTIVNAKMAA
jgi:hypothetical protein